MECFERDPGVLEVKLSGSFTLSSGQVATCPHTAQATCEKLVFLDDGITRWDTSLLALVLRSERSAGNPEMDLSNMPEGLQRLHALAHAPLNGAPAPTVNRPSSFLARLGGRALDLRGQVREYLHFVGELFLCLLRLPLGKTRFRGEDLWIHLRDSGPGALGIVSVIGVLVGAILAFVGAVQLRMFNAEVFVANLVGLGMVMEMGALMTGIILAGRTGASFAAQLGTMQVNEEVDALRTMGIRPAEYLVLPRVLALSIMTPLLVLYADALGIAGGALVGILLLDIPPQVYLDQTFEHMTSWHVWQGLIKGSSFGVWIAVAGCLRGMQCGRSASAVGRAATSAVVAGILGIVVIDSLWTYLFMVME